MTFEELGLDSSLLEALHYAGFENPTPIQEKAIPLILNNRDVLACAQTGTGKTAAFLLPILQKINHERSPYIDTLIIAPTRELAHQIDQQVQALSYFVNATSYAIYGGGSGQDFESQKKALEKGADIIIATPGKLISHLNMGYVNFKNLNHLVLDEADRMLDMGFYEDIMRIASHIGDQRQNLMFSATMPDSIRKLAKSILKDPAEINIARSKPAEGILQAAYMAYNSQKERFLIKLIADKPNYKSILIFTSTKKNVGNIVRILSKDIPEVKGISSDLDQKEREETLRLFAAKRIRVLVATDILGRGIDIKDIDLVINYDIPDDPEDYVHRIGRTARAKSSGVAISFINPDDVHKFLRIEKLIDKPILKLSLPKEFGNTPPYEISKSRGRKKYGKPRRKFSKR